MFDILFRVHYYLNPGTGSLIVQLLAAGVLGGIGILIKVFWARIKAFFKGEKYVPPQPEAAEPEPVFEESKLDE
jgi:hypothetical protein